MLHQPSKYHTNPLSHFLALHSNAKNSINSANNSHIELDNSNSTSLDVVNENIGKSFTIAAILGLKQSAAAMEQSNNKDFADVINLSLNQQQLNKVNLNNNYPNDNRFLNHGANMVRLSAPLSHNFNTLVHQTAMSHHASNANSALQSLQQLHHQQSAQNNSGNTGNREKCRIDSSSSKKSSMKSKRVRTIFTPEQLERLEAEFERQQYMVGPERLYLAHTLQLTEAQVKVWFQNRRIKWRKHHLEITQQRLALIRQRQLPVTTPVCGTVTTSAHSEPDLSVCTDSLGSESMQEPDES